MRERTIENFIKIIEGYTTKKVVETDVMNDISGIDSLAFPAILLDVEDEMHIPIPMDKDKEAALAYSMTVRDAFEHLEKLAD